MKLTPFQAIALDGLTQGVFGAYRAQAIATDAHDRPFLVLPWFDMSPTQRGHWRSGVAQALTLLLDRGERRAAVLGEDLYWGCHKAAARSEIALDPWDAMPLWVQENWTAAGAYLIEAVPE